MSPLQSPADSGAVPPSDVDIDAGVAADIDAGPTEPEHDAAQDPTTRPLSFFWGDLNIAGPGANVSHDTLTLGFDAAERLHYVSWKALAWTKTFGPAASDYPRRGTKHVVPVSDEGLACEATAEAGAEFTATRFRLSLHVVCKDGPSDYVESIEGTRTADGWQVVYLERGRQRGVMIEAHAAGAIYAKEPGATLPPVGLPSIWSGVVEFSLPHPDSFNLMTVRLDAEAKPREFALESFDRPIRYGTGIDEVSLAGPGGLSAVCRASSVYEQLQPRRRPGRLYSGSNRYARERYARRDLRFEGQSLGRRSAGPCVRNAVAERGKQLARGWRRLGWHIRLRRGHIDIRQLQRTVSVGLDARDEPQSDERHRDRLRPTGISLRRHLESKRVSVRIAMGSLESTV
jgi:hypothetical protein